MEQLVSAAASGRLSRLGAEMLFLPSPERFTLEQAAAETGVDPARIRALWRAIGLPDLAEDDPRLTPAELALVTTFDLAAALFGEPATMQLLRVVAASMSRIADAAVSTFIATAGVDTASAPTSRQVAEANSAGPRSTRTCCARWMRSCASIWWSCHVTRTPVSLPGTSSRTLAVGFVDVVGSSALALHTSLGEIGAAMQRFDTHASDIVTAHGGRVVKFIGDEVMYQVSSPAAACEIALGLVAALRDDDVLPGGGRELRTVMCSFAMETASDRSSTSRRGQPRPLGLTASS